MNPAGGYTVGHAGPADEAGVRALLREPMGGAVRLALEREPDSRLAADIEGDRHVAVVVRDAGGRVMGTGSRAVRTVWLDGRPARLGYLSQMRRHPALTLSAGAVLRAGFALLARTRAPDELPYDLTSIAADNHAARRLLERGVRGVPPYRPLAELVTCLVPTGGGPLARLRGGWRRALPPALALEAAGAWPAERLEEVVACLARNLSRCQLAPVWTAAELASPVRCRGLAPADFRVVRGAGGAVTGCAALWDQRDFKQARVHGYAPRLARARPLLDPLLRLAGRGSLPPPGSTLRMGYLSHAAVDGDDADAFLALLGATRAAARDRGLDWLVAAFAQGHPLLGVLLRATRPRTYRTVLHAVAWEPDAPLPALHPRPLHVEAATL